MKIKTMIVISTRWLRLTSMVQIIIARTTRCLRTEHFQMPYLIVCLFVEKFYYSNMNSSVIKKKEVKSRDWIE